MSRVICVKNLIKRYKEFTAVDNLSFNIEEGKIYGFLGVNGAGKSTTINMICGLLNATEGEIKVFSQDIYNRKCDAKKYIGLVPQNIAVYMNYSVEENIKFFGSLYDIDKRLLKDKVTEAIKLVGLQKERKKLASQLSGGMQRRLNIACSIVHNPKLLILDEPTLGIDPKSRKQILQTVQVLNKRGTTVLYTTHYMDEVESICDEIIIIHGGKVLAQGTKQELKELVSDIKTLNVEIDDLDLLDVDDIKKINGVEQIVIRGNILSINSNKDVNNLDKIILYFIERGIKITDIKYKEVRLEDVFLKITGEIVGRAEGDEYYETSSNDVETNNNR